MRTVFGLDDRERLERLGAPLRGLLDILANRRRVLMLALTQNRSGRLSPWGRFAASRRRADELIYEEIAARRRDPAAAEGDDVFSLLLAARDEEGRGLTDDELRDELMTLLLAGHETTATALAWVLERVTRHRDVLERLHEEQSGRGRRLPRRGHQGDAAPAAGGARGDPPPAGPDGVRRLAAARRRAHRAVDLPAPPPARHLSRPDRVPPGALPREAPRHVRVDPVRRRDPPLPRRELRAVRDADRAGGRAARGAPPAGAPPGAEATTRRAITFAPSRGGRIALAA